MRKSKHGENRDEWKLSPEEIQESRAYKKNVRAQNTQRIQEIELDESWIGAAVWFIPGHAEDFAWERPEDSRYVEQGHITNWNSRGVFVCYEGDRHSKITYPRDLIFKTHPEDA